MAYMKLRKRQLPIVTRRLWRFSVSKTWANDPARSFYEFSLADAVITELARIRIVVVRPSSVIAEVPGVS